MKFSIAITTYNRLPLLRRSVESALNQTLPCEIAIVDDASSDGTQEYFSQWCLLLKRDWMLSINLRMKWKLSLA
ncbi:MAG: glycosyltransferase family 2 protein [Xenococcaceae cyanobacterium]